MVTRGTVLVQGERVPGRARLLEAGHELRVRAEPEVRAQAGDPSLHPPQSPAADRLTAAPPPQPPSVAASTEARPPRSPQAGGWQELARRGEWDAAYRELGALGLDRVIASAAVEELLAIADTARLSGHPAEAVAPLTRVIDEHPGDPRAALAAFTLGRVEERLGNAPRALRAFERAIDLGLPEALRGDALAELARVAQTSGRVEQARAAAREYLRTMPDGMHRTAMRALAEGAR